MVLVFIASLFFVNALEWLGHHLKLGSSFVGAILSPLFTSFEELVVVLIAIFSGIGQAGPEIGIGTIFGEPFMASSLSYGLLGITVIAGFLLKKRERSEMEIGRTLSIPYAMIIVLFPLTLIPGFIHVPVLRYASALFFLGAFVLYIYLMYSRRSTELIEESEEPILAKWLPESPSYEAVAVIVQIVAGLALLLIGSRYLVSAVATIAQHISVSPLGLAVIVIPAATALPETLTALIWGYKGKDTLSVGSLVGEKILYCTFYPALGLVLTSWVLDIHAVFSVIVTTVVSAMFLWFILKGRLPWSAMLLGLAAFVAYGVMVLAVRI